MHPPRPPSISQGVSAAIWGVIFGGFVWVGLLAVDVAGGTAFIFGLIVGVLAFFVVRIFGNHPLRRGR